MPASVVGGTLRAGAPVDEDEIVRTMAAAPKYGVEAVSLDE